jgi:hypothetical protein
VFVTRQKNDPQDLIDILKAQGYGFWGFETD